ATYNAWHGLKTGSFWVTLGETPEQNQARLRLQAKQIAHEGVDLVFLQEVNPLPHRAEEYVTALRELGHDYTQVHQVDACGIRVSEERALIKGLNNGLAILAKKELQLAKIEGLKLSGDIGNCESTSGIQLEELRYALIAEITMPGTGIKYLVVSVHLHSGFESGTDFLRELSDLDRQGRLKHYAYIKWEIEKPQLRRIGELDKLVRELSKRNQNQAYAGIATGGDFNFEGDSPEHVEAIMLGLSDTYDQAIRDQELYTADPVKNGQILHEEDPTIPKLLEDQIKRESSDVQEEIISAYRVEMKRPRRIDHILVDSFFADHCLRQELFGLETNAEGLPASDHYGILNTYFRSQSPCPVGTRSVTLNSRE
ncbi:MAG: endonuclease/exonuclease/phosphatase family protein, partial [Nitrospiraceae bacterium]